jgi:hypothetical protein
MGEHGYMMVYPNPQDALYVLSGNIDEITKVTNDNVVPELSEQGAEILAEKAGGADDEGETDI